MSNFWKNLLQSQHFAWGLILLIVMITSGCYDVKKVKQDDGSEITALELPESTTSGEIKIGIDETMEPVMRQEVDMFMELYQNGIVHSSYQPEGELIQQLLDDSVRLVVISRNLRPQELARLKSDQIRPEITQIGKAAIALIGNKTNPIDSLTAEQLGKILRGELKNWRELGGEDQEINIVFDHPQSGIVRYVQDRFLTDGDSLPPNAFTAMGTENVIDYVHQAPNALGLVGVSWVSDRDDPKVQDYLEKVRLVRMETPDTSDLPGAWVRPFQNEIELGRWPLTRNIYAISREHFSGLGTGFVVFVAGERGQRILLKAGVMPAFMPPRMVVFPEKEEKEN